MIVKPLVQHRFSKAFASYGEHANLQKHMSQTLFEHWQSYAPQVKHVLELGCGTGNLSRLLAGLPTLQTLYLNDLCAAAASLEHEFTGRIHSEFHAGDMDSIAFPTPVDAVVSSSALQWSQDLPTLLNKISASLPPRGWLVFASFGPSHYQEVKALTGIGLHYPSLDAISTHLQAEFELLWRHEAPHLCTFATPMAVLQHMRQTGVSGISQQAWTKSKLQQFCQHYAQDYAADDAGVVLSQHPLYLIARKKPS
ncbi:malonyl-ACP O-methyltransferase BioC [Vitreoscilla massiliensis]|uniref:Malonyl-[acyl-carrier protein] O-methyltransferase n=1 Tax=Vitreoscilla massiliensis TaxID=1689272 RepID=A0ABY4DZM2_9NEIS|nr:malonyl-ACP O-methyltransferase BioC [Vitreoscilla massiliensis]UOO87975.1 malonyl-ACP O-methyltransferase BioC [Vitreoscilla massiliensis]